jgi:hypothetical protein
MVVPPTPKPTCKAEALAKAPPTIAFFFLLPFFLSFSWTPLLISPSYPTEETLGELKARWQDHFF